MKNCARECQRIHWKCIHRYLCQEVTLRRLCNRIQAEMSYIVEVNFLTSRDFFPYKRNVGWVTTLEILKGLLKLAVLENTSFEVAEVCLLRNRHL